MKTIETNELIMKKVLFITISIVLGISFISLKTAEKTTVNSFSKQEMNPLALYGENVFKRENCMKCHTLTMDKTAKISLDGYSNANRSAVWLYQLFENPRSLIARCKMPPFKHLINKELSQTYFIELMKSQEDFDENNIEKFWNLLLKKSDILSKEIYYDSNKNVDRKEVIALIEFLRNIPTSKQKQKFDKIQTKRQEKEVENWDEVINKSDELVSQNLNENNSIKNGKATFETYCVACHNKNGTGLLGPNLIDKQTKYGSDAKSMFKIILLGTENGMPEHNSKLKSNQIIELIVFLKSLTKEK